MTSDAPRGVALALALLLAASASASAAEPNYPFEGTWIRANRVCAPNAPRVRTYTAKEVTFPTGHCGFRKIATGGGLFEIFEDCRRAEHPGSYTETIRMLGPDLMQVRRSAARLKIGRPLRYTRCSVAAPAAPGTPAHPASGQHRPAPPAEPRPGDPKAQEPRGQEPPRAQEAPRAQEQKPPEPAGQKTPEARP